MKKLFFFAFIAVIVIGIFFAFRVKDQYTVPPPTVQEEQAGLAEYFGERIMTLGVTDIGQPIEGFDADLLMQAYPGLLTADFKKVETLEGHYEVDAAGKIMLVRNEALPVSSAERTLSTTGYGTLLRNVSGRLLMPIYTKNDVDALITRLDTAQQLHARFGETVSALGVTITPFMLAEESRCAVDVTCIQAGTVRIKAALKSGLGESEQEFELNRPVTTETETITLIRVEPEPHSQLTINETDYIFHFEVKKR